MKNRNPLEQRKLRVIVFLDIVFITQFVDFFQFDIFACFKINWWKEYVFSGVRVTRYLVLCVMFCRSSLSFYSISFGNCVVCPSFGHCVVCPSFGHCVVCPSFGHCVVCPSSIYGLWIHLWYIQTFFFYNIFYTGYLCSLSLNSEHAPLFSRRRIFIDCQ